MKEPEGQALVRRKEKGRADKYRHPGRSAHLIGAESSRENRNVAAFEVRLPAHGSMTEYSGRSIIAPRPPKW